MVSSHWAIIPYLALSIITGGRSIQDCGWKQQSWTLANFGRKLSCWKGVIIERKAGQSVSEEDSMLR